MNFIRKLLGGSRRKVFVLGLDCAAPELVFDRWRGELPNLTSLVDAGLWGELESSIPAITVPAWSSMFSGKDPGELGIYGFRNRADHSYDKMFIATSRFVKEDRVWKILSEAQKDSVVIGVPQTYPVEPLRGNLVAGFLTPGRESEFTYPASLKDEILSMVPDYEFDVGNFRTDDKDGLLRQIWEMTRKRVEVVNHLLTEKPWDLFVLMEIGVDRIHHGFWSYHDPGHWRYEEGNPFETAILDYYKYIDDRLGEWMERLDDDTAILVVSDHGAKRMDGGICVNEWLRREGLLVLKEEPPTGEIVRFDEVKVDWEKTKVWASGGYYARIFINVEGREPSGVVPREQYQAFRDDLASRLIAIPDHNGEAIGTKVFKPEDIYQQVRGIPPDLLVYFGDLYWRSVGSLGFEDIYTFENDTGPDDCNHAQNGLFILYDPARPADGKEVQGAQLMDVATTLLRLLDVKVPQGLQGMPLWERRARS